MEDLFSIENENTIIAPPRSIQPRCAEEILLATRFAVNIVVVKTLLPTYPT
jgi:hypothetical protein